MGEKSLQILMPMAGLGSRFRARGFELPKPLIEVAGRPLFEWSRLSLGDLVSDSSSIAVVRDAPEFANLPGKLAERLPGIRIRHLDRLTRGPVETCLEARDLLDPGAPLVILDCDLHFRSEAYLGRVRQVIRGEDPVDGVLLYHRSRDPRFSYARIEGGRVLETAEKNPISDHALVGSYFFARAGTFFKGAEALEKSRPEGELFVSQVYQALLEQGSRFVAEPAEMYLSFGTPEELAQSARRLHSPT